MGVGQPILNRRGAGGMPIIGRAVTLERKDVLYEQMVGRAQCFPTWVADVRAIYDGIFPLRFLACRLYGGPDELAHLRYGGICTRLSRN